MICTKCGTQSPDGTRFCPRCGSPLTAQAPPQQNPYPYQSYQSYQPPKKKKTGLVIGICVAIAAVITGLVFLGIWLFGDDGPLGGGGSGGGGSRDEDRDAKSGFTSGEAVVKAMVKAMASGDSEAYLDLLPKEVADALIDAYMKDTGSSRKQFLREFKNWFSSPLETVDDEYGDDWKLSVEDLETEPSGKSEFHEIQDQYGMLDLEVTDAANISYTLVITAEDGRDTSESITPVVKIGGRWYLHEPAFLELIALMGFEPSGDQPSNPSGNADEEAFQIASSFLTNMLLAPDVDAVPELCHSDAYEAFCDYYDLSKKEMRSALKDYSEWWNEDANDTFDEWFVDFEFDHCEPYNAVELEELQEYYDELGADVELESAVLVVLSITLTGDGDTATESDAYTVVTIDGKQYLDVLELDAFVS